MRADQIRPGRQRTERELAGPIADRERRAAAHRRHDDAVERRAAIVEHDAGDDAGGGGGDLGDARRQRIRRRCGSPVTCAAAAVAAQSAAADDERQAEQATGGTHTVIVYRFQGIPNPKRAEPLLPEPRAPGRSSRDRGPYPVYDALTVKFTSRVTVLPLFLSVILISSRYSPSGKLEQRHLDAARHGELRRVEGRRQVRGADRLRIGLVEELLRAAFLAMEVVFHHQVRLAARVQRRVVDLEERRQLLRLDEDRRRPRGSAPARRTRTAARALLRGSARRSAR